MGTIGSVSKSEIASRRRQLRRSRQKKLLQTCWQLLAVSSLAGGLVWATTSPAWVLDRADRIGVEGNQFLSDRAIRSLLPLSYPHSLLEVRPRELAKALESHGPIAKATVSRQLFPPGLKVEVQERYPVAIAVDDRHSTPEASLTLPPTDPAGSLPGEQNVGLLDERGVWMPLESYTSLDKTLKLPELRVVGDPDRYRPYWPPVYREIHRSPVKIYEINWQDPTNPILKTELGIVHLGPDITEFPQQITILAQMQQLPNHIDPGKIAYIDLSNPESPALQLIGANSSRQPHSP